MPFDGVLHFIFPNQYSLTSSFMRVQGFYESSFPDIKNNVFELEHFMDRYAEHFDNFTYTTDWEGFNVPGDVLISFKKKFKRLLNKEKTLFSLIIDSLTPIVPLISKHK